MSVFFPLGFSFGQGYKPAPPKSLLCKNPILRKRGTLQATSTDTPDQINVGHGFAILAQLPDSWLFIYAYIKSRRERKDREREREKERKKQRERK